MPGGQAEYKDSVKISSRMIRSSCEDASSSHNPRNLEYPAGRFAAGAGQPEGLTSGDPFTSVQTQQLILRRNVDDRTDHSRATGGKILCTTERKPHPGNRCD